jgi:hypothetical protein
MNLLNPASVDVDFEFDMVAAKKYNDADIAGKKAALRVTGKGNSASVAYSKAFDAVFYA